MTAQKAQASLSICSLSTRQTDMFVPGSPSYLHWPWATSTPHAPVKSEPDQYIWCRVGDGSSKITAFSVTKDVSLKNVYSLILKGAFVENQNP